MNGLVNFCFTSGEKGLETHVWPWRLCFWDASYYDLWINFGMVWKNNTEHEPNLPANQWQKKNQMKIRELTKSQEKYK